MRILIVEGNTERACEEMKSRGWQPYAQHFASVLRTMSTQLEFDIAHPADRPDGGLPDGRELSEYAGAVWTGSSLCISEGLQPAITRQVELARQAYKGGIPVFGSCWGLQVMCVALGGAVHRCPAGREIGIARHISLSGPGLSHAMYTGKAHCFDALATHRDEVLVPPHGAVVLASNAHSPIQALAIEETGRSFWGVQYHPEFDFGLMARLLESRGDVLMEEGFFIHPAEHARYIKALREAQSGPRDVRGLAWQLGLTETVLDPAQRYRELRNWLRHKIGV